MCDCYTTLDVTQHSKLCQSMLRGLPNNKLNRVSKVLNLASFVDDRNSCNSPGRTDENHEGHQAG